LAVDSRSSSPEQRPYEEQAERYHRICFHCERPAWTGSDDANKIVVMPRATWKNEPILAAATSGSSRDCDLLRSMLTFRAQSEELTLEQAWRGYSALNGSRTRGTGQGFDANMVIVTPTKLWMVEFQGNTMRSYQEPRDQPFARGSGRDAAMLAMTAMGRNAVDAVWAARAIDPATGGPVRYFDTTTYDPENKDKFYRPQKEKAMTREQAMAFVRGGFVRTPETEEPNKGTEVIDNSSGPSAEELERFDANAARAVSAAARKGRSAPAKKVATKTTTKKRSI
jgi:hypothetical protein